jgi:flagellar motility protein MotE (MotC chaperone)
MRFLRDVRLIPVVLVATVCLFVLKVSGLVLDGGYTLGERLAANSDSGSLKLTTADTIPAETPIVFGSKTPAPRRSWAQEMFNFGDVTGSVPEKKDTAAKTEEKGEHGAPKEAGADEARKKEPAAPPKSPGGKLVALEPGAPPGERAILERLQGRREQLDERSRALELRENLLKAAEKRVEARVAELRDLEAKIKGAEAQRDQEEAARFKGIVAMYESMKPKDAARIFDRLDLNILVDVSTKMKPATMAAILAQMSPETAERLTVELAGRASSQKAQPADLPQIRARPNS